jgi:uncharacterized membrane protein
MLFGISIIRWILIVLSLFFIIDRFLRFIKKETGQTFYKLFSTLFIWGAVLTISIFPTLPILSQQNLEWVKI